ncbi:MAG TPA: hypothetical protein PKY77_07075 [Phycisphaerae bacterium]|nr:hypothetical protein [Phycisphaerae bacterium]HRY69567.1 hypothetical protein [Phycisphaerae bacterium]HSA26200.1 hypothetical protein [Phycisphaerae bacterium]
MVSYRSVPRLVTVVVFSFLAVGCFSGRAGAIELVQLAGDSGAAEVRSFHFKFAVPRLAGQGPAAVAITPDVPEAGWTRVSLRWDLTAETSQDELAVVLQPSFAPDFHWLPHLAPEDGFVAGQHVFRSPAAIVTKGQTVLVVVPDLDLVGRLADDPWFLDLDAAKNEITLGMVCTEVVGHVGFRKKPGMVFKPGRVELAFYVAEYQDADLPLNPWKRAARLLWRRWGRPLHLEGQPGTVPMDVFVKHTYDWAFDRWGHAVWQEFELNGRKVGAPQFIVNISQSPNYPGPWYQREFLSIWNQAWFSSLRSASGLARWARRMVDKNLRAKAELTKVLALAAPMKDGIFPAVIGTATEKVQEQGKEVVRPRPWSEATWRNSNRSPRNLGISDAWYHVLDASWTCLLMLRWHQEIAPDEQLVTFCRKYADKLLRLQDERGFFPGWLNPETLEPSPVMFRTPETAMSVTFLLKMADVSREGRFREAAIKAADALLVEVVPEGRWEDFETYWSCCAFGRDDHVGRKYARNGMYKQCNFSMFWTAEALLAVYRATGDGRYLAWGRRTLDELSMCQQVWQPPFIYVPALGGFGVMNFDGEWNDSRQSLYAELFMDYYRETGESDLFERGISALKASFVMMYCPENPQQKEQWEKAHPFFGPRDYGFMMENYGHGGRTGPGGIGIGTFTIYDWGNGAASEARNRIYDHYGDVFIDRARGQGFGIDSIRVQYDEGEYVLTDLSARPRAVKVVFDDDSTRTVQLDRAARVR